MSKYTCFFLGYAENGKAEHVESTRHRTREKAEASAAEFREQQKGYASALVVRVIEMREVAKRSKP